MRLLGLVLVAGVLSACASASVDPDRDAEAKLFRAPADKACIYVVPTTTIPAVAVTMDGRTVGRLEAEDYFRLDVSPGRHVLSVAPPSLMPSLFRETRDGVAVDTEAGRCYFLRTVWADDPERLRQFRVFLERVSEAEGQRGVNVRMLKLPGN
jgi:hypothetical protein